MRENVRKFCLLNSNVPRADAPGFYKEREMALWTVWLMQYTGHTCHQDWIQPNCALCLFWTHAKYTLTVDFKQVPKYLQWILIPAHHISVLHVAFSSSLDTQGTRGPHWSKRYAFPSVLDVRRKLQGIVPWRTEVPNGIVHIWIGHKGLWQNIDIWPHGHQNWPLSDEIKVRTPPERVLCVKEETRRKESCAVEVS